MDNVFEASTSWSSNGRNSHIDMDLDLKLGKLLSAWGTIPWYSELGIEEKQAIGEIFTQNRDIIRQDIVNYIAHETIPQIVKDWLGINEEDFQRFVKPETVKYATDIHSDRVSKILNWDLSVDSDMKLSIDLNSSEKVNALVALFHARADIALSITQDILTSLEHTYAQSDKEKYKSGYKAKLKWSRIDTFSETEKKSARDDLLN